MLRRPQNRTDDHQSNFHASEQKSFPQDTNYCCATADKSVGIVSDSRMNAQCSCPGFSETCSSADSSFSLTLTLSGRCTLPRKRQTIVPCEEQFVSVLVTKAPNVDRTVAWSTSHGSTQTEATNNQTALGIESSLCHNR